MLNDSFEQAAEFAASAMRSMQEHGIAPTPANFQIWYSYASGRDAALNRAIDILASNDCEFNEERNAEIYEQFFGVDAHRAAIEAVGNRLEEFVSRIAGDIGEARDDVAAFGDRVADLSGPVGESISAAELRGIAHKLVEEARAVVSRGAALERKLDAAKNEVTDLRRSLVETRKEATTDKLTGIANRREFERHLQLEAQAAGETGAPLSLIFLDVDRFKDFNDRHGHRIGDEVLKLVAGKLRNRVRDRDLVARFGGEEFVALLPDTPLEDAAQVAERIRVALASSIVRHRASGEAYGTVTASFGIATYCPGEALEYFVQRADEALYRAKRDGRNRVELADNEVVVESVDIEQVIVPDEPVPHEAAAS